MTRPPLRQAAVRCLLGAAALASLGSLPVAGAQVAPPPHDERAAAIAARIEAGHELARRFAPHLVRIRAWSRIEGRLPDGRVAITQDFDLAYGTGIVVDARPRFVISAALGRLGAFTLIPPGVPRTGPRELPRFLEVVLADGTRLPLVVIDVDRSLGLETLALADETAPPPELRRPLPPLAVGRLEPAAITHFTLVGLEKPDTHARVLGLPGAITAIQAGFARPAVRIASSSMIGCPLLREDGSLLGLANLVPPEMSGESLAESRRLASEADSGRDPSGWMGNSRVPLLFGAHEFLPYFEHVRAEAQAPRDLGILGASLADVGGTVVVAAVVDGDPPLRTEPPLRPGDLWRSLDGAAIATVAGFEAALERSVNAGAERLELGIERDGTAMTLEILVS
jgi:hypothetical protein